MVRTAIFGPAIAFLARRATGSRVKWQFCPGKNGHFPQIFLAEVK
jgi:hypothetical protein